MTVEQVTTLAIADLESLTIQCKAPRCRVATTFPLALLESDISGRGVPPLMLDALDTKASCTCGAELWPAPPAPSPARELLRALMQASRRDVGVLGHNACVTTRHA